MARRKNDPTVPEPISLPPEDKPSQAENVISVILGLAVVLVIGAMIINAIRNRNPQPETAQTDETKQEQQVAGSQHTVAAGETLWSIAEKYYNDGYKWTEIQKANNMSSGDAVEVGMTLTIPTLTAEVAEATEATEATKATETTVEPQPTVVVTEAVKPPAAEVGSSGPSGENNAPTGSTMSASTDKQYTVKPGDTLWAIAVATYNDGYRWVDIAKANSLQNPDIIHAGNKFILP